MNLRNDFLGTQMLSLILGAGVLAGGLAFSFHTAHSIRQVKREISQIEEQNKQLYRENKQLRYINDLAVEFSMDPFIVALVDHYSRNFLKENEPEWRVLKTPELMTCLMLALINMESEGNPGIVGDYGKARGLTQIWISTAQDYGEVTAQKLLDPETNIAFSFRHFHYLLKRYEGDPALTLSAWNLGHGTVDRILSYGQSAQSGYGKRVYEAALIGNAKVWAQ